MKNKMRWLRYDLHMHSQFSKAIDGSRVKEMSAEEYVEIVSKKTDVFSITDHNCYNSKYYSEIRNVIKDKDLKLIDGAELDVYVNEHDYFQMGVYFEENDKGLEIENKINELYNDKKPNLADIISELLELNIKFILIPDGNKSRGITKILDKISQEHLEEITKYAMYKIFSGYDVKQNFNRVSQEIWATNYYKTSESFNKFV